MKKRGSKFPEDVRQFDAMESLGFKNGIVMRVCKDKNGNITRFKLLNPQTRKYAFVDSCEVTEWDKYMEPGKESSWYEDGGLDDYE